MSAAAPDEVLVCLCACPDLATARMLGRALVDERLAACVQVLPGAESIYRWNGAVESAAEILLILKTTRARHEALQARLIALHPYEVPELVALPAVAGLPAYLHWVADSTRAEDDDARDASPATD
jgi:periplasmic divalent cation tolerance protein